MIKQTITVLSISVFLLLTSCGQRERKPASNTADFSSISAVSAQLTDREISIALRVCLAYRKKSTNFRAELLDTDFRFFVEETECDGSKESEFINTKLKRIADSSPLIFDSTSGRNYFREVQTHDKGELSDICSDVIKGDKPKNQISVGLNVVEVTFFGIDEYQLRYGRPNTAGGFDVYEVHNYKVETNETAAGIKVGLVSSSVRFEQCTGSSSQETFKQTYQEI